MWFDESRLTERWKGAAESKQLISFSFSTFCSLDAHHSSFAAYELCTSLTFLNIQTFQGKLIAASDFDENGT